MQKVINHKHLYFSFHYAIQGLWYAIKYNQNVRIHLLAGVFVIVAGFIFRVSSLEMGMLAVSILLVICAEMVNTAIEQMVDLITKEHRAEAKIAKDVAAGMVLITAIGALFIGILIFFPHVIKLFS